VAINEAQAAVREGAIGEVPQALRDAHYPGAKTLGHGASYRYPHDDPAGIVAQEYSPEPTRGAQYYRPSKRGYESELAIRIQAIQAILRGERNQAP